MMKAMKAIIPLLLLVLAAGASAQSNPYTVYDLEIGYRWLDVTGNEDMYRTQINEEDGFLLRAFSMSSSDVYGDMKFFDHLRIDVSEMGVGPAGAIRLDMGKTRAYRLLINYRDADQYSALPAWANPFLAQGVIPGQHTIDRNRKMLDIDLELFPGRTFTPFIGYSSNSNKGPGTTTYHFGQDEFQLAQNLDESEDEFRVGLAWDTKHFYGRITQGWRSYEADETLTLVNGEGNNGFPVLGRPIEADTLTRTSSIEDKNAPYTNVFVTGELGSRVKLIGTYVTFDGEAEGLESETASGSFASFPYRAFFNGVDSTITSAADVEASRAGVRAEIILMPGLDLLAGYEQRERDMSGMGLLDAVFFDAETFGGLDLGDLDVLATRETIFERTEDVYNVGLSWRSLGPFSLWANYSETDQEVLIDQDIDEIVVPGFQEGSFERNIKTFDAGGNVRWSGFTVGVLYKKDDADDPILRTDYLDRERIRIRAAWQTKNDTFRIGFVAENLDQSNNREGTGYDGEMKSYSADARWSPNDMFSLWGAYSVFEADSTVLVREPASFTTLTSVHSEDGDSFEAGVDLKWKAIELGAGIGHFENEGTNPFEIDRYRARLAWNFTPSWGASAEWARDSYEETGAIPTQFSKSLVFPPRTGAGLGDYEADRIGAFLRWRPVPKALALPAPPPPPPTPEPEPEPAPVPPPPPVAAPQEPQQILAENIAFEKDSARVTNIGKAQLDDVALRMRQEPASTAVVTGYVADGEAGEGLDRRRAEAVRDYLMSRHDIDASRISVEAGGSGEMAAVVKLIVP
jgi:outer membrane protein OmpA-like peptidoglycan-associated protein